MWLGQEEKPAVRASRFKISKEAFSRIKGASGRGQEKAQNHNDSDKSPVIRLKKKLKC